MTRFLYAFISFFLVCPAHAAAPVRIAPARAGASVGAAAVAGAAGRGPSSRIELDFNLSPSGVQAVYAAAAKGLIGRLDAVASVAPEAATFQNTVDALERAYVEYGEAMAGIRVLSASPDEKVRAAVDEVNELAAAMSIAQSQREDIYRAVMSYAGKGEKLEGLDKKLLEETLRDFRSSGMSLSPEDRERFKKVSEKVSRLVRRYSINLREWDGGIPVRPEDLGGVPAGVVKTLRTLPDGRLFLPDDGPAADQVFSRAKSARTRMRLYYAIQRKAAKKNIPILRKVLTLRQEQAEILGYENFAAMQLDGRMAKTPKRVMSFLTRLKKMLREASDKEEDELLAEKRREKPRADNVHPWDGGYYGKKLLEKTLDLDAEKVRQYFPADRAIPETLKVYEELLGVRFVAAPGAAVWHEEVRAYDIHDADGKRMARLYLDLFSRKGKKDGAWATPLVGGGRLADGTYREPIVAVSADFDPPEEGKPALLRHGNVKTLFHELGHAMHMTLTTVERRSFAGSAVAWDFVEAPSQMMENFIWTRKVLARVSGHYESGSPIPAEMIEKLLKSRKHHAASPALVQAAMSAVDMIYYTLAPRDVLAVFRRVMKDFTGRDLHPASKFPARFGHILSGYAAGYYGYLWSRVFAQDIYSAFEAAGILSPAVGARYRAAVLEVGASRPEEDSLKEFLGRTPDEKAFLRWLGVR